MVQTGWKKYKYEQRLWKPMWKINCYTTQHTDDNNTQELVETKLDSRSSLQQMFQFVLKHTQATVILRM